MQNNPTEPMTWDISLARRMFASGMKYTHIASVFGVTTDTVHSRIDPEYRRKRQEQKNEHRRYETSARVGGARASQASNEDLAARLADIPDDTRNFTARAFGDPIPSRSAANAPRTQASARTVTLPFVSILAASKQEGQPR